MSLPLRGAGRPAALARSKSGALGIGAGVVKREVSARRPPRRARRSAINAGRGHGIDELAVGRGIPLLEGKPALLIGAVCVPRRSAVLMSAVISRRCVLFHARTIQQWKKARTPPVAFKFATGRLVLLDAKCSPKRNNESICRQQIQAITRCHLGVDSPVLSVRIVLI